MHSKIVASETRLSLSRLEHGPVVRDGKNERSSRTEILRAVQAHLGAPSACGGEGARRELPDAMRIVSRGVRIETHEPAAQTERPVNVLVQLEFAHVGLQHAPTGHEQLFLTPLT